MGHDFEVLDSELNDTQGIVASSVLFCSIHKNLIRNENVQK